MTEDEFLEIIDHVALERDRWMNVALTLFARGVRTRDEIRSGKAAYDVVARTFPIVLMGSVNLDDYERTLRLPKIVSRTLTMGSRGLRRIKRGG